MRRHRVGRPVRGQRRASAADDLTSVAVLARSGDGDAMTAFVERTLDDVWRYCAYVLDADRADDATQATYVRAMKSIDGFRGDSSAKSWLIGVARHVCLDEMRSGHRRLRLLTHIAAQPSHDLLDLTSGGLALRETLDVLAPDRREAFVLTQLLGFSYDEAADIAGCAVGTIRSRVSRARSELIPTVVEGEHQAV